MTIGQAEAYLDALAETFPEALFQGLNGGVNLLEESLPDGEFPEGEMYILGEYCDDLLGRYINLYYGSFAAMAEREDWTLGEGLFKLARRAVSDSRAERPGTIRELRELWQEQLELNS